MIEELRHKIPASLRTASGKVFYSGRLAFSSPATIYVLGINPGGDPSEQANETVARHTDEVLTSKPRDWSAYRDESWDGAAPGTFGMQPRLLHIFTNLGMSPGGVPCSNLVFLRSRREDKIEGDMSELAERCWPFHEKTIHLLEPRIVLCLGQTVGKFVRKKLGATRQCDEFIENNRRRWRSTVFVNESGVRVIVATHPSIVDWTATDTDPSSLIKRALVAR